MIRELFKHEVEMLAFRHINDSSPIFYDQLKKYYESRMFLLVPDDELHPHYMKGTICISSSWLRNTREWIERQ